MHTLQIQQADALSRSKLVTVTLETPLLIAPQQFSGTQLGLVVVCEANGTMAGVISKTDIIRQIGHCMGSACRTLAQDLMTRDVVTWQPNDLLHKVLSKMQAHGLVHVPLVDQTRCPVGVVNARDALRLLVTQGQYEQAQLCDYVMGVVSR